MLNLYYKPTCPYSLRVLKANETIKAPLLLLNVRADDRAMDELIKKGGKAQVPYLEDTERGVAMYESIDIIDYLAKHYAAGAVPVTAQPGNVCPID
ncbi:MAG: glutathione S-transferase N-terminal domain-containing protein [Candidatus Paceibacteria bacterium]